MFNPNRPYVPYTFPEVSFLKLQDYITNLVNQYGGVYWPLDDVANNPYNRVINTAVAVGRNILIDGTAEAASTTSFAAGNAATLSKQPGTRTGGSGTQVLRVLCSGTANPQAVQTILSPGRVYTLTAWVRSDGNAVPQLAINGGVSVNGTNSTSWQQLTVTGIAQSSGVVFFRAVTSIANQYVEWDDMTVTELNIPAYNATPSQLLNTDVWNNLGTAAWIAVAATVSMQTTTRHDGLSGTVIRIARNAAPPRVRQSNTITVGQVYRCYGWCRSDGVAVPAVTNQAVSVAYFTGTTSTDWQPFDFIFVADNTSICLQSPTNVGTQYVEFDVTVVALDTGIRQGNVVQDGDAESGIGAWIASNAATLSHQSGSPHSGTNVLRVLRTSTNSPRASQPCLIIGKKYRFTGYARSDGTGVPQAGDGGLIGFTGTNSTSWQLFDFVQAASSTSAIFGSNATTGTPYVEFDDITITELSPLVAVPVNGAVLGNSEAPLRIGTSVSFDGVNDLINLYSAQLNGVFNPDEGTLLVFGKFTGSWTDATSRYFVLLSNGANNQVAIRRTVTNNQLILSYTAGSTGSSVFVSTSTVNYMCLAITWSKSADQVIIYFNGVQSGSIQTGLGTWSGNLTSTVVTAGAGSTAGASPLAGNEASIVCLPVALAADYISEISKLGDAF